MKIAVLVFGMYREFDIAIRSWDFIKKFKCDVYMSTWARSIQSSEVHRIVVDEIITKDTILKKLPTATVSVKNDILTDMSNAEKAVFHWKCGLNMIQKSNKVYDYLILTRTDNFIEFQLDHSDLMKKTDKDTLYGLGEAQLSDNSTYDTQGPLHGYHVQDIFLMGNYYEMSNFIKKFPTKFSESTHYEMAKQISLQNLKFKSLDSVCCITIRPNCRKVPINELHGGMVYDKLMEWHGETPKVEIKYKKNNILNRLDGMKTRPK
jgi:hypothetical protein